jgi:hypothetical protein
VAQPRVEVRARIVRERAQEDYRVHALKDGRVWLAQITLNELEAGLLEQRAKQVSAEVEAIEHAHLMAALDELFRQRNSDVSTTTNQQDLHRTTLLLLEYPSIRQLAQLEAKSTCLIQPRGDRIVQLSSHLNPIRPAMKPVESRCH